jgi:O-antigen ligase
MMLAVGMVIALVGIIKADEWRDATVELVALPLIIMGVILSASRAAILGLIISVALLVVFSDINTKRVVVFVGGLSGAIFFFLLVIYDRSGLSRFTAAGLQDAVTTRLTLYKTAILDSGLEPMDLLFGGGMYRYSKIAGPDALTPFRNIIYPHNYVISLLVHVGLIAAALFALALIWNYRSLLHFSVKEDGSIDYITMTTLLSLIVISMYSFTSGRVTRTFPLWVFLAISEYVYASRLRDFEPRTQLATLRRISGWKKQDDEPVGDRLREDIQ